MSKFKNIKTGYQNFGYALALAGTAALFKQVPKNNSILDPQPVHWVLAKVLGIDYSVLEQFWVVNGGKTSDLLMVGMEETPGWVLGKNI